MSYDAISNALQKIIFDPIVLIFGVAIIFLAFLGWWNLKGKFSNHPKETKRSY